LQKQGIVKSGASEPIWTGAGLDQIDDDGLYVLDSYDALINLETTRHFVKRIFTEPVFMYRNTDIRFALPKDAKHLTPPHQDHFFIRQTDRFRTAWIPLMNIQKEVGGLMIHRALPNTSDRIRLSLDARYQPLSEPRSWQAEKTIAELRQYRRRVREISLAEDASEDQFKLS